MKGDFGRGLLKIGIQVFSDHQIDDDTTKTNSTDSLIFLAVTTEPENPAVSKFIWSNFNLDIIPKMSLERKIFKFYVNFDMKYLNICIGLQKGNVKESCR